MNEITLNLHSREVTGKAVKQLLRQGTIPAVIHDHGKPSIVVMAPYGEMLKAYQQAGKHHPVQLSVDGKKYLALIKDIDYSPKKNTVRHIVFGAVKANEQVTAEIPVHIVYDEGNESSPAERAGLIVLSQLDTVEVEALPKYLPDAVEVNGEKLVEAGDQLTIADLILPANVSVKTEADQVLATVFEPSALQAANDEAGGDEEPAAESADVTDEPSVDAVQGEKAEKDSVEDKK